MCGLHEQAHDMCLLMKKIRHIAVSSKVVLHNRNIHNKYMPKGIVGGGRYMGCSVPLHDRSSQGFITNEGASNNFLF